MRLLAHTNSQNATTAHTYPGYLHPPLTEKGPYFQKSGCENRTRAQKLSTRRTPRQTSISENRTPGSENHTLLPWLPLAPRELAWGVMASLTTILEPTTKVGHQLAWAAAGNTRAPPNSYSTLVVTYP